MRQKYDLVFFTQCVLVALAFFGTARLGYLFTTEQQATAVLIWPPAGIGLAAVLIFGRRVWPAISLGALAAYVSLGESLAFALPATVGNTIEPILGAWLLSKLGGFSNSLDRIKHTLGLLVGTAIFCTISSALIGATALSTSGIQPWSQWGSTLVTWWFGDAMGVVVVTPLLLVWSRFPPPQYFSKRMVESFALAALLVVTNWLVFGGLGILGGYTYPLAFLGVPLIIWAAVRFGQYGASAASAITVFIAVLSTAHGTGPFVSPELNLSLVLVWLFSVVIASTALVLGATVTEREQAELALKSSEKQLHALSDASFESIFLSNKGICIGQNLTAQKMFGYTTEEAIGKKGTDWILPEDRETVFENIVAGNQKAYEVTALRKNGTTFPCEIQARTISYKGVGTRCTALRDITQRKQLEEQLRQSQKLEAIGTLAGGIAHDFNNILFAISGNSELAKEMLPIDSEAGPCLDEIKTACKRAARLVKQLLAFSRPSRGKQKPVRIDEIIRETTKLVRATIPTTIKIDLQLHTPELCVVADSTHMQQIILNLCTNAGLAMAESGGILLVELTRAGVGSDILKSHPDLGSSPCAVITVADSGCGISPETLERIFEPFFTTREVGKGSGMGLAVVHGLVTNIGGKITVESILGKGTTFKVFLPAVETKQPAQLVALQKKDILGGNERILLVDDEKALATMLDRALTRLGYSVISQTSSIEAWKLFRENPGSIDLVITDQTMPDITGVELAGLVKGEKPDIPVILLTGHAKSLTPAQSAQSGISAYILKPTDMKLLASTIRELLGKNPANLNAAEDRP